MKPHVSVGCDGLPNLIGIIREHIERAGADPTAEHDFAVFSTPPLGDMRDHREIMVSIKLKAAL